MSTGPRSNVVEQIAAFAYLNRKSRVTVVTSNRARACTPDTSGGLSLPRVAVLEAPSCKWIDLAQNHFLTCVLIFDRLLSHLGGSLVNWGKRCCGSCSAGEASNDNGSP